MRQNFFDMLEEQTICPYTGLRPFTEEESLYFKGREENILKVSAQLEEKKFLMVTGASGDGKSSLIFAGLLPQARAGFINANYSNWQVANFRPERSPLKNLARALANALQLEDPSMVEVELSRGFSSLVELYKSSNRYVDEKSEAWRLASEEDRGKMERQAGNLLILIDQFEEFFTNPENFPGGVPSQESRLLLNIILETVKISLKENLPIYIVCTMRSDYIGQCAAFRGLPEFIGFSQFFVPRLQRKELHQVIEEPAILSGNRISNRLIDRLIFDLEEGTDQLPILQHALKQIWKAADSGREEMDLIHYAMVGGMPGDKLPKEEISRFQLWKQTLADYEQRYLENAGLANVLDIHANKLYEEAAAYYNANAQALITSKQAKFIIAISFACLTRIDESRAVRNRMTLEEVMQIINVPELTTEVVGGVLSIFREPDNTLIGPFIGEADEQKKLSPATVLDITHEALIRNWKLLKKWADQEYEYHVTFLDFQQQFNRWIEHGKSGDFLLPIGSLTYFEDWYKKCRPNKYWINRYNHDEADADKKLKQSAMVLKNCRDFIKRSALRLLVTRTFMKHGAGKISMVAGFVALLVLISYFLYQWRIQDKEYVLNKILADSESYMADIEPNPINKGSFALEAERYRPGYIKHLMRVLPEQQKIEVALNLAFPVVTSRLKNNLPVYIQSLLLADSLVQASGPRVDSSNNTSLSIHLNNLNDLVRNQSYYLFANNNHLVSKQRERNVNSQAKLILKIFAAGLRSKQLDMKALHITVTDALNYQAFTKQQINSLIDLLSPMESNNEKFDVWFPEREKITIGFAQNFSHNGGYQMLAYLYAANGNSKKALQCLDSLKKYNPTYEKAFINSTHVSVYFLIYGHPDAFSEFIEVHSTNLGIPAHAYVKEILTNVGVLSANNGLKYIKHGNINDNLQFLGVSVKAHLFSHARELCKRELKIPDALNFNLSLLYKLEGVLVAKETRENGIIDRKKSDSLFQEALSYFGKVSAGFLEQEIVVQAQTFQINTESRTLPRKHLFLYPDHFKTVESFIQPAWFRFHDDAFFYFMLRHDLFSKHYKTQGDYQLLITWINTYFGQFGQQGNRAFLNYPEIEHGTFLSLDSLITQSGYDLDDAWIKMMLIRDSFNSGDTTNAYALVKRLTFKEFEKVNFEDAPPFHNSKIVIAGQLAIRGKRDESMHIIRQFANTGNRVAIYAKIASLVYRSNNKVEAEVYLDSANAELKSVKDQFLGNFQTRFVEILTLKNNRESKKKAMEYIGSMAWFDRLNGLNTMVTAYARLNEYYKAASAVPPLASAGDRLGMYTRMLRIENLKRVDPSGIWQEYDRAIREELENINFQNDLIEN